MPPRSPGDLRLRDVAESDLSVFFEHQLDPVANHMAAFTRKDPTDGEAFAAHWAKILADETVIVKTILFQGQVTGHVAKWERDGKAEVTYWIGRSTGGRASRQGRSRNSCAS